MLDAHLLLPSLWPSISFSVYWYVRTVKLSMEVGILHVVMMAVRHSAVGVARVVTCTAVVFVRMCFARSVPCLVLSHFLHAVFFEDWCLLGSDCMLLGEWFLMFSFIVVPLKYWEPLTHWCSITSWKILLRSSTAVRTLNLAWIFFCLYKDTIHYITHKCEILIWCKLWVWL